MAKVPETTLRAARTVYVDAGVARKRKLKKMCALLNTSQAKFVNGLIDKAVAEMAEKYPQLKNGSR